MITASTLIFMKSSPENDILRIDFLLAAVCTVLYTIDFYDLILTTVIFSTPYRTKEDYEKMKKDVDSKKETEIQKIMEVYKQETKNNSDIDKDSLHPFQNPNETKPNALSKQVIFKKIILRAKKTSQKWFPKTGWNQRLQKTLGTPSRSTTKC